MEAWGASGNKFVLLATVTLVVLAPAINGDSDGDGFPDSDEDYLGTNPNNACANTPDQDDEAVDAMPADLNDDQRINVVDLARVVLAVSDQAATQRADLNADGAVNVIDRTIVVFYIGLTAGAACTP